MNYQTASIHEHDSPEEKVEVYFKRHYAALCQPVYRMLGDKALAEDLVQEVFVKVWERRNQLTFNDRFIYYLKRSCYHAALSYLASNPHQLTTEASPLLPDSQLSDEPLQYTELQQEVRRAISRLPEKTRLVFSLVRYEELSYREVAESLQISTKAVEKHMTLALKRLRESLHHHLASWLILLALLF